MNLLKFCSVFIIFNLVLCTNLISATNNLSSLPYENSDDFIITDLFIKASDASLHSNLHTSINIFRELTKRRPQNNYFKKKLALELIKNGELFEPAQIIKSIVDSSPDKDEELLLILASLYVSTNKPEAAIVIYKDIIKSGVDIEEACMFFAKRFSTQKKYNKAHAILSECEKKSKGEPIYAFMRGKIEFERGNKLRSEKFLKKSLKLSHSFDHAALVLGSIYEQKNDYKTALKIYKDFLNTNGNNKNAAILTRIVALLFLMEDNNSVIPYAESLNEVKTNDLDLKVRLGFLYSYTDRLDDAISTFKEALAINPTSDKLLYYIGIVNQQAKHYTESINYFRKIPTSSLLYKNANEQINFIQEDKSQQLNFSKNIWTLLLKDLNTVEHQ